MGHLTYPSPANAGAFRAMLVKEKKLLLKLK
jgi:hypothetical protein